MNRIGGRILGVILGGILGGPIGAVLGFIVGYLFDSGKFMSWLTGGASAGRASASTVQTVFFNSTFSVMGHLAKADGHVTEAEIKAAKAVMDRMSLDQAARQRAIEAFNLGKSSEFNLDATLTELKRTCWFKPTLLRFFLETQIQIAFADGHTISASEQAVLTRICQHLGISNFDFSGFASQYRAQQNYSRYQQGGQQSNQNYQQYQRAQSFSRLDEAYKVIGVAKTATDAEVKKAYRKLMSENHPDRLIAKGVPQEMIKMATERTQQIQKAYEDICRSRGKKK
ncbi:MAG: co-chaperone DjlA [Coxiellaceae bacterium]|nr:co-chaperone DjlA [Coxiellaceae bacterium]